MIKYQSQMIYITICGDGGIHDMNIHILYIKDMICVCYRFSVGLMMMKEVFIVEHKERDV